MPLKNFNHDSYQRDLFSDRLKKDHPHTDEVNVALFSKEVYNLAESIFDFCNICNLPHNVIIDKVYDQLNDLIRPQAPESYNKES